MATPTMSTGATGAGGETGHVSFRRINLEGALCPLEEATLAFRILDGIICTGHRAKQRQGASIFFTGVFVERHVPMVSGHSAEEFIDP